MQEPEFRLTPESHLCYIASLTSSPSPDLISYPSAPWLPPLCLSTLDPCRTYNLHARWNLVFFSHNFIWPPWPLSCSQYPETLSPSSHLDVGAHLPPFFCLYSICHGPLLYIHIPALCCHFYSLPCLSSTLTFLICSGSTVFLAAVLPAQPCYLSKSWSVSHGHPAFLPRLSYLAVTLFVTFLFLPCFITSSIS